MTQLPGTELQKPPPHVTARGLQRIGELMVSFVRWSRPGQYAEIVAEHRTMRATVDLADVSNMGDRPGRDEMGGGGTGDRGRPGAGGHRVSDDSSRTHRRGNYRTPGQWLVWLHDSADAAVSGSG